MVHALGNITLDLNEFIDDAVDDLDDHSPPRTFLHQFEAPHTSHMEEPVFVTSEERNSHSPEGPFLLQQSEAPHTSHIEDLVFDTGEEPDNHPRRGVLSQVLQSTQRVPSTMLERYLPSPATDADRAIAPRVGRVIVSSSRTIEEDQSMDFTVPVLGKSNVRGGFTSEQKWWTKK
jgi:hypothetical protein